MRTRIIIGSIMILALAGLFWLDLHVKGAGSVAVVVLLSGAAVYELSAMLRGAGFAPYTLIGVIFGAALPLYFGLCGWLSWTSPALFLAPIAALMVAVIARACWAKGDWGPELNRVMVTTFGVLYVALPMALLICIRFLSGGWGLVVVTVAATKVSDMGAYFTGRFLGRHKLAPRISPNKTIEGSLGGLAASMLLAWLLAGPCGLGGEVLNTALRAIVFGLVVGIGSQIGDLTESFVKRAAATKDSGALLPAFGGVLDVIDSFLVAAPVAYVALAVLQG
jgi:phosphatidate cytidylyltransferase